eukprot:jgi/Mesen1/6298/ME000325S05444
MSFFSALVWGVLAGVALVGLLSYFMTVRSRERQFRVADVTSLSRLDLEKIKLICGENTPTWINFQGFERVKWLNNQLKEIWPYVNKATSVVIREQVEPMLEQYKPIGITSLKFQRLTLGDVAPQVGGVSVSLGDSPGQVILDIDFKWGGDPRIVLAIQTLAFSLRVQSKIQAGNIGLVRGERRVGRDGEAGEAQLKNLELFTTVRVIFQLSDELPCIAAVVTSLLAEPKPVVKYNLLAVGGSLTAIPGLAGMIDEMVQGALTDTMVWPERIVVPIIEGYDTSGLEMRLQGCVSVTVVGARGLRNVDIIGKSDPYVTLWTRNLFKVKTRVIKDSLHPTWNETFKLDVDDPLTTKLILKVQDQDIMKNELLGVVAYPLSRLTPEQEVEETLPLHMGLKEASSNGSDQTKHGTLTIRMKYHKYTRAEQDAVTVKEKELKQAKAEGRVQPGAVAGAAEAAHVQEPGRTDGLPSPVSSSSGPIHPTDQFPPASPMRSPRFRTVANLATLTHGISSGFSNIAKRQRQSKEFRPASPR